MSEKSVSPAVEYARQLQEKFELYLLGLVFTLLALAVQSAKFGSDDVSDLLEIAGWLGLLLSGLVGLWRVEWIPVTLQTHSELLGIKSELAQLQEAAERGLSQVAVLDQSEPADIAALIANRAQAVPRVEARVNALEAGVRRKYTFHKYSFAIGLVLLVVARAYVPVGTIVKKNLTNHSTGRPSAAGEFKR